MKKLSDPIKDKDDVLMLEKFFSKSNLRNQLIFLFGINTGLRVSDILALNIKDVKNKDYVEIKEIKTKKYKKFPLNIKLKKLIESYLVQEEDEYTTIERALFIGKKNKRLNRSQVYRFLNNACQALNIQGNIGTHTMRKTFAYHHYKKYKDVALLQKILNHSAPQITLKYIGIYQEEIDFSYMNFEL